MYLLHLTVRSGVDVSVAPNSNEWGYISLFHLTVRSGVMISLLNLTVRSGLISVVPHSKEWADVSVAPHSKNRCFVGR